MYFHVDPGWAHLNEYREWIWMLSTFLGWLDRSQILEAFLKNVDGDDTIWGALCGREQDFQQVMGCLPSPSLSLTTQFYQLIAVIFGRVPRIEAIVLAGCEQTVLEWLSGKHWWTNELTFEQLRGMNIVELVAWMFLVNSRGFCFASTNGRCFLHGHISESFYAFCPKDLKCSINYQNTKFMAF